MARLLALQRLHDTTTKTTMKATKTGTKNTGATNQSATEAAAAKKVEPKQAEENSTGRKVRSDKGVKRGPAVSDQKKLSLKKLSLDVSKRTLDDLKAEHVACQTTYDKSLRCGITETQPEAEIRHRAKRAFDEKLDCLQQAATARILCAMVLDAEILLDPDLHPNYLY